MERDDNRQTVGISQMSIRYLMLAATLSISVVVVTKLHIRPDSRTELTVLALVGVLSAVWLSDEVIPFALDILAEPPPRAFIIGVVCVTVLIGFLFFLAARTRVGQWVLGAVALILFGTVLTRLLRLEKAARQIPSLRTIGREREVLYQTVALQLETELGILGIALNAAFEEHDLGHNESAWRLVELSTSDWKELAEVTGDLLRLVDKYILLFERIPMQVRDLPHLFKSQVMVDQVRSMNKLSRWVFRSKPRFQLLICVLRRSVQAITEDFLLHCGVGQSHKGLSPLVWSPLDLDFHDFDLLVKETLLAFRAFLVCLPDAALEEFAEELQPRLRSRPLMEARARIRAAAS